METLVKLVPGDIGETVGEIPKDAEVSLLMIDADGCIDRDLRVLWKKLSRDCSIIIDDCSDVVKIRAISFTQFKTDAKMRLAYLLLAYFKEKGLLSEGEQFWHTYFGRKVSLDYSARVVPEEIISIYRKIVFLNPTMTPMDVGRQVLIKSLFKVSPVLLGRLRAIYRNGKRYRRI